MYRNGGMPGCVVKIQLMGFEIMRISFVYR